MSRRNDTPVPEFRHAWKPSPQTHAQTGQASSDAKAEVLKSENHHASESQQTLSTQKPPLPGTSAASPTATSASLGIGSSSPATPVHPVGVGNVDLPRGEHFPTKDELDSAIARYRANPGKCPICNCKIGRGIAGHLSKCLRSSKFKTASTPTS